MELVVGEIALFLADPHRLAREARQPLPVWARLRKSSAIEPSRVPTLRVALAIQADIPGSATDDLTPIVSQNCRTLQFRSFAFEES
jgi:hypothetical protein